MNNEIKINETWIKASILGTIWAAFEIVLGSFLHNLKIPFSGNILTAIAIIILIAISFKWTEKGLYWRAGLICALMKTMSPSGVIFGPMIAIIAEAVILELFTMLLGRTYIGYTLGSIFAMFWNLIQKIGGLVLFYGLNIVNLYNKIIELTQKELEINFNLAWLPIFLLLFMHIILGVLSAYIGIKTGEKLLSTSASNNIRRVSNHLYNRQKINDSDFAYSYLWLVINAVLIIASLIILNSSHWIVWSLTVLCIVTVWIIRYKKSFRRLLRPKFWIFFFLLTMISALAFSNLQAGLQGLNNGLLIGLQMNFRAIIIISGFSVLGTELYNPKIRSFFMNTYFKQLPVALELSFESLPSVISTIPDYKIILKNPVSVFYEIISQADFRLTELKNKINFDQKIYIISGGLDQGKTNYIKVLVELLKKNNIPVGGIYSPKIIENNKITGYYIVNISSNEHIPFLEINGNKNYNKIGRYFIDPDGLQKGLEILKPSHNINNKIVVIDEVGKLELDGKGWANCIEDLIQQRKNHIILGVRDSFIENVVHKWNFKKSYIYKIDEIKSEKLCETISKQLD